MEEDKVKEKHNVQEEDSVREEDNVKEKDNVKDDDNVKNKDNVEEKDNVKANDNVREEDDAQEKDSVKEEDNMQKEDNVQRLDNAPKHLPRDTPIRILADISTSSLESSDKFQEVRDLLDKVIPLIFRDPDTAADTAGDNGIETATDVPDTDVSDIGVPDTGVLVDVNLLAIEIRGRHTFAIFDAYHDEYDFLTAHESENNQLPVYRVRINKRGTPWVGRAPNFDEMINGIVSELHRLNGYEVQPPYIRDHGHGPIMYCSPRGLKIAVPKEAARKETEEEQVEGKVAEVKEAEEKVSDEAEVEGKEAEEEKVEGEVAEEKEEKEVEEKVTNKAEVEGEVAEEKEVERKVAEEKESEEKVPIETASGEM